MANLTALRPPQPWSAPTATDPVRSALTLPGSKSMTARALVLAALAAESSTLRRPLRARDTELMAGGLGVMGAEVSTADDARWTLRPRSLSGPCHVDVGLAGTVMRFVPPVAALADGPVTFDGDPAARTRPLGPLLGALRAIGVDLDPTGDGLPLTVRGTGRVTGGEVSIDASGSSQFVSALLLAAPRFAEGIVLRHVGPPVPSAPHLLMTTRMLRTVGAEVDDATPDVWAVAPGRLAGHDWDIEPDLSGAAPFFAAALVTGGEVTLGGWPTGGSLQPIDRLRELFEALGGQLTVDATGLTVRGTGALHGLDADLSDVSELTPVLAALAALADSPSRLRGVAHIRGHETDRIAALARELSALGADVTESTDGLLIRPRPLHGAVLRTYDDHRMAHAAAVLGLAVPGIELTDVACTAKTLPQFPALWSAMVTDGSVHR